MTASKASTATSRSSGLCQEWEESSPPRCSPKPLRPSLSEITRLCAHTQALRPLPNKVASAGWSSCATPATAGCVTRSITGRGSRRCVTRPAKPITPACVSAATRTRAHCAVSPTGSCVCSSPCSRTVASSIPLGHARRHALRLPRSLYAPLDKWWGVLSRGKGGTSRKIDSLYQGENRRGGPQSARDYGIAESASVQTLDNRHLCERGWIMTLSPHLPC